MFDTPPRATPGTAPAVAAFVVGLLFALISAYWAAGGTWLADTVGGTLEREGGARNVTLIAVLLLVVLLKVVAALLGLLAVRAWARHGTRRIVRAAAWTAATVMSAYGAVLTCAGLLVQIDVIHASADADHRALAWHAYLWDPWFLVWGLLLVVALRRSGETPTRTPQRS